MQPMFTHIQMYTDLHTFTWFIHCGICVSENLLGPLSHTPSSIFMSTSASTLQLAWADVCEVLSEICQGHFYLEFFF